MNIDFLEQIHFNVQGLIPAIAVDVNTNEVLMMAWMNKNSLIETLTTKQVCYWSRSRNDYWRKGQTSGNQQQLVEIFADCDMDTLLIKVKQKGAACHTGRRSCFFNKITDEDIIITSQPIQDPKELYK